VLAVCTAKSSARTDRLTLSTHRLIASVQRSTSVLSTASYVLSMCLSFIQGYSKTSKNSTCEYENLSSNNHQKKYIV